MKHRLIYQRIGATIIFVGLSMSAHATDHVAQRQQAFKEILRTFEPMGMMVRGARPFKLNEFVQFADRLAELQMKPWNDFPLNSQNEKSRSKPEIWSQPHQFDAERVKFANSVMALQQAAHEGDKNVIRARYGEVARSCKSCHDHFRLKPTAR